jgi:hypothetical protein
VNRYNVETVKSICESTHGNDPSPGIPRRHRIGRMQAWKGLSMEKWLCWGAMGVAGVVGLIFLLDLFLKIPLGGVSKPIDVIGLLACAIVGYLGWDAWQDIK